MRDQTFQVNVVGKVWAGYQAAYSRDFTTKPTNILAIMGDFETIDDHQVIQIDQHYDRKSELVDQTTTTRTIIKDWALPENGEFFAENSEGAC